MAYNFPKFFELTTTTDPETNSTVIAVTKLRQNFVYFSVYSVYSKLAIDVFAYIMIVVLNSFIITKIVHSTRFRRRITENEGETTTSRPEGTTSTDNATPTRRLPNYRKPSEVDHSNEHLFANEPMNSRETSHTTKRELGGHI